MKLKKPKLLIITTTPLIIEFFLKSHVKKFAEIFSVEIALPSSGEFHRLRELPCEFSEIKICRKPSFFHDIATFFSLCRLLLNKKPTVVWSVAPKAGLLGNLAAMLLGIEYRVFIFQGEVWASKQGAIRHVLKLCDRITAACSTHVLAVSRSEKQLLVSEEILPDQRLEVLGSGTICGVDCDRFKENLDIRKDVRQALGISENQVVCLFVGRITKDKGIHTLLAAFSDAAEICENLVLLTVGPEEEIRCSELRLKLGTLNSRFFSVGYTERPEDYMAAADFLCLPSFREGFGMVVLEAAAVGIPSIASNIPGLVDAVDGGKAGVLVEVGNIQALTSAMLNLSNNKKERLRIASIAQERVYQDFDQETVVNNYFTFFKDLKVSP